MKVPDELVEAALEACDGTALSKWGMSAALEAVLPKVRERLLSGAVTLAVLENDQRRWEEMDPDHPVPLEVVTKDRLQCAFDHAFPEEGSSERCQLRHLKVAGFTCSCGWTAPADSADIDDIDVKNPPQEGS